MTFRPPASAPELLRLVADPQRWRLLVALGRSDLRVGELASATGNAQNLVSYHLGELRSAGLVSARRSSADGRDTYYRLHPDRLGDVLTESGSAVHPAIRLGPRPPGAEPEAAGRRRPPRVLFLCTGNSARSQIAQALIEQRSGQRVLARSAGSQPKPLHPNAVRVMAERGVDIAGRRSKHLDRYVRQRFDRVVTLCDKVREVCPEFPGPPVASHWSMADPAAAGGTDEATYAAFVRTADEIDERVGLLIAELERSLHA